MKISVCFVTALMLFGVISGISQNNVAAAEVPGKCTNVHIMVIFGTITIMGDMPSNHVEADIKGLHVYRGTDEGNLTLHDTLTAYSNTVKFFMYQDASFYNGIKYYYRVAAFNDQGDGELSDLMNATVNGIPPRPLEFVALANYGSIELTWQPPVSDGGKPITNYSIFRGVGGAEPVWVANTTARTFIDDNVTALENFYDYEVCAVNEFGAGKRSERLFVEMPVPCINGTLVNDDQSPVDGMKVEIDGNTSSVVTDINGTFSFPALPGTHVIKVWDEDRLIKTVNVTMTEAPRDLGKIGLPSTTTASGSNGDLPIFIVAGIAIAALAIIGVVFLRRKKS